MEADMECPKCRAKMRIDGDKWVCSACGYQRDVLHRTLSHAEALKELQEIKKLSVHISSDTWESDVMTMVYNLRRKPGGLGVRPGTLYFSPDKP